MEISKKDYEDLLDYKIKFIKDIYNNVLRIPLSVHNIHNIIIGQAKEAIVIASMLGKDLYETFYKYGLKLKYTGNSLFIGNFEVSNVNKVE